MGKVVACVGKFAVNPYYDKQIGIKFFSIEEICYYIKENAILLDRDIMKEELIEWIDSELELKDLARELRSVLRSEGTVSSFIALILMRSFYCLQEEIRKIEFTIRENANLSPFEKQKKRADYFLKSNQCAKALADYEEILHRLPNNEYMMISSIYHNMGVSYAKQFLFEGAAEWFLKAYEINSRKESMFQYMISMFFVTTKSQYKEKVLNREETLLLEPEVRLRIDQVKEQWLGSQDSELLQQLEQMKQNGSVLEYYKQIDLLINHWKETFRSNAV